MGCAWVAQDPGHDHVDGGSVAPVGGPHDERWLRCEAESAGGRDAPVPKESAVHSMEHGDVWLTHRPDVDAAPLAALEGQSDAAREHVLVSPLDDLPDPVVAVTWSASLAVEGPDDPRLTQFVRTCAGSGQGGETGVPCTGSDAAVTPEQAAELLQEAEVDLGAAGRDGRPGGHRGRR